MGGCSVTQIWMGATGHRFPKQHKQCGVGKVWCWFGQIPPPWSHWQLRALAAQTPGGFAPAEPGQGCTFVGGDLLGTPGE